MRKLTNIFNALKQPVHIAPLAVFRVLFGGVMLFSIVRFAANGWIADQYIDPTFHFGFYGFEWIKPLGEWGMYALFALIGLSALMMALGWKYRLASITFFLTFTYVELIDPSYYLNHYYFISIVSFLLCLMPAHRYFSIDAWQNPAIQLTHIPRWMVGIFQLQLGIVYFYAGIAKLNYDWLFEAMPMRIWLPANAHLPLVGWLFDYVWVAFAFSWLGAVYDLSITFLLSFKRTRVWAYMAVIGFHLMTAMLFQIGMFPYIMVLLTLVFFSPQFHVKLIDAVRSFFQVPLSDRLPVMWSGHGAKAKLLAPVLIVFFVIQIVLPWRYVLYPDNLFWTEEGYRFSWRVMLMEKGGTAVFHVKDPATGKEGEVWPADHLCKVQEKMMATQPDMILQFAHYLEEIYHNQGIANPEIRVESYVTLNGSGSRLFIDPTVDLTKVEEGFSHKGWVLPFENDHKAESQAVAGLE